MPVSRSPTAQHFYRVKTFILRTSSLHTSMPLHLKKATGSSAGSASVQGAITATVKGVINGIRTHGESAVRRYSEKFDKWSPSSFKLSQEEIDNIISTVPEQTLTDIKEVQANVRAFAEAQRKSLKDFEIEIKPGVHLGQKNLPIKSVGAYIFLFRLCFNLALMLLIDISQEVAIPSSHQHT
jgi:histidinol dehydrogenase